jgi:hypothetical protein
MSLRSRQRVWIFVVIGLVCVPADLLLWVALNPSQAPSLSANEVSSQVDRFFSYPAEYRRQLFRQASETEQWSIRRRLLDEFVSRFRDLTDEQRGHVEVLRSRFAVNHVGAPNRLEAARDAALSLQKVLATDQLRFLHSMGPDVTLGVVPRAVKWIRRRQALYADGWMGNCWCSTSSDFCGGISPVGPGGECRNDFIWMGVGCAVVPGECGLFGLFDCDGLCWLSGVGPYGS